MKGIVHLALTAAAVAGVNAQPHHHAHQHLHAKKEMVEKRVAVTVTAVVPATVTQYVLDGQTVEAEEAQEGIHEGVYIVVGSSTPTFTPPPPPSSTSASSTQAANFLQLPTSSSSAAAAPSHTGVNVGAASLGEAPAGSITASFPNGTIPCSTFPSSYGAVSVPWIGTGGWTSIQQVGSWIPGVAISNIVTPISGGCTAGSFCSYACPAGYEKSQWPETSQGATGQSIGGLWCNAAGFLELSRPSHPQICEQGAGGVTVQNKLSGNAAICRTDYPATENMNIPLDTQPGGTYPLTNPVSSNYYVWEGKTTTAQYYVNPMGVAVEDACLWTSPTNPSSAGNWAPINFGVGQDNTGTTYISIFANLPTSTATLNFNVEIQGANSECWYRNGQFYGGGNGCTVSNNPPRTDKNRRGGTMRRHHD